MTLEQRRALLMSNRDLYPINTLSQPKDIIGEIPGVPVGTVFPDRKACYDANVHRRKFAGIHGSLSRGAYSIVLSGGYEDDEDNGEYFTYTGAGGQADPFAGMTEQVEDQSFNHKDNMALKLSVEMGNPIRVIRGFNLPSKYAPAEGYRYDGLYIVESAYMDKGKSGFKVCKFDLRRLPGQAPLPTRYLTY